MPEIESSVPATLDQPAPGADDQKPNAAPAADTPAPVADAQNPEPAVETPEQLEAKKESRRQRSNARKQQQLADARAEAKYLREQLAAKDRAAPQASDEPKRDQFDDYESYARAAARWDAKQVVADELKTRDAQQQGREQQNRQAQGNAELAKSWTTREAEFQKATKDYDAVVTPFLEEELQDLHPSARQAIVESELGPQLLYHLASHPSEAERISGLSPARQTAELGKLELSLPKTVKVSSAPPPATPLGSGRAGTTDLSKMSDAEYKAARKAQGARWAQ